jgi:hypothetical protein
MSPGNGIEICPLDFMKEEGTTGENQPLFGHETTMVNLAPGTIEELFVHHYQTDQLLVVRGTAVLVVLQNRRYEYILMSQDRFRHCWQNLLAASEFDIRIRLEALS